MANIPRVLEAYSGEAAIDNRRARVEAILKRTRMLVEAFERAQAAGQAAEARMARKRAHQEARMTARLIGIMEIEFGIPMAQEIVATRELFKRIKAGNGGV